MILSIAQSTSRGFGRLFFPKIFSSQPGPQSFNSCPLSTDSIVHRVVQLRSRHLTSRLSFSLSLRRRSLLPSLNSLRTMASNGEARPKRRGSPVNPLERPTKHLKQELGVPTPGDSTPANGTVYDVENELNSLPILNAISAAGDSPEWQATIETVIKSVVSIHFCQTCSFDTDLSTSSQATGFVVDAERGYILTNRHVVCSGPFWGYCIFDNHEEVSLDTHLSGSTGGAEFQ